MLFAKIILLRIIIVIVFVQQTFTSECGVRKLNINKVIVHGQSTSHGDWPWHVAIYHKEHFNSSYACGGTLLSKVFVLTADHCVRGENGNLISSRRIFIRLGLHSLDELNTETFQQHNVYQIYEYNHKNNRKNDISILELATEAKFTDYVQPACLNQEEDLTRQFGTAIGWGTDETDALSIVLKCQRMPVVNTNQCLESNGGIFRDVLDSSVFCAGYTNGTTVCNGDSGGGLHFKRKGVWYVGGIISFTAPRDSSNRCHLKSYAGFTNVYHFLPWIRNITGLGYLNENRESNKQEPNHPLLPQDCGRYLVNRISGGTRAELYEFPWVVRLLRRDKGTGGLLRNCHGSLINKRYVLTIASCATHEYIKPDQIVLGDYDNSKAIDCNVNNASDCAPPVQRVGIESIIAHPKYNESSFWNDIALIRLDRDIEFEDHIQPICLPVTQSLRQQRLEQGIVAGWGWLTKVGDISDILQKATVRVIDESECRRNSNDRFYVGDDVICTRGNGTPNTCIWDDGTPLGYPTLYNERVRFVQYGVASINGCDSAPSTHTFVPNYMDWILANLSE